MRFSVNLVAAVAAAAVFGAATSPASAECKRYGFSVNDYGKDGPTKDAKDLLDKLIASKMSEKGVSDFHTGKKNVSCELFLNFIVFDEHTCTAEATVCWGGTPLPNSEQAAAGETETPTKTSSDDTATPKASKKKQAAASETETATKTSSDDTATPKTSKKKKEATAQTSEKAKATEHAAAETKPAIRMVPDPKPAPVKQAEKKTEERQAEEKKEAAEPQAAVDAATADAAKATTPAETPASTTAAAATKPAASAAKPVETGSLSDSASKPAAKHKVEKEKPADDQAVVTPIKQKADGAGYPTPVPPQADSPNP